MKESRRSQQGQDWLLLLLRRRGRTEVCLPGIKLPVVAKCDLADDRAGFRVRLPVLPNETRALSKHPRRLQTAVPCLLACRQRYGENHLMHFERAPFSPALAPTECGFVRANITSNQE